MIRQNETGSQRYINVSERNEDAASLRDREKINKLKRQYDLSVPKDVERLNSLLLSGSVRFETEIGQAFDDQVYELVQRVKAGDRLDNSNIKNTGPKKSVIKNKDTNKRKKPSKAFVEDKADFSEVNDPTLDRLAEKEIARQDKMRKVLIVILSMAAVASLGYFLFFYYSQDRSQRRFVNIKELVGSEALKGNKEKTTVTATLSNGQQKDYQVLDKYQSLYNSNQSLIGWIQIADTNIDYPVMQCGDNTYYLSHNFDSKEDKAGALFLDCNNSITSSDDNYIIYGHHLTSGRMFSSLGEYEKESYYNKHKFIIFDTIYEEHTYQVMYAFRSRVYNEDDVVFKYYQFINANSEEEFNSYMAEMKAQAFYDTGVSAAYGDTLLTLSTCDYHEENGRFVVVARRIK